MKLTKSKLKQIIKEEMTTHNIVKEVVQEDCGSVHAKNSIEDLDEDLDSEKQQQNLTKRLYALEQWQKKQQSITDSIVDWLRNKMME